MLATPNALSRRRLTIVAAVLLSSAACHSDHNVQTPIGPPPPATRGTIIASVSTTGGDKGPNGYTLALAGGAAYTVGLDTTVRWDSIAAGAHAVMLSGLAQNCSVAGGDTIAVTLTAGDSATAAFQVVCRARTIAFASNRSGTYQIYTILSDSSALTPVSDGSASDQSPAWSADGSRIVFSRRLNASTTGIYTMHADGSGATAVTTGAGLSWLPQLSSDGARIVFQSNRDGAFAIYVVNIDGTGLARLTTTADGSADRPSWSPDGTRILYGITRNDSSLLYSMKPDGSDKVRIALPDSVTGASAPMYSPDGTRIVYVGVDAASHTAIHVMHADGTGDAAITDGSTHVFQPVWSPDGLKVAYVELATVPVQNYDIYIVSASGTGRTRLTSAPAVDIFPAWKP